MSRYRICYNEAPHVDPWWTVEREERGWRSVKWQNAAWRYVPYSRRVMRFKTEAEAKAWIDNAKRPRVHKCGEPQ